MDSTDVHGGHVTTDHEVEATSAFSASAPTGPSISEVAGGRLAGGSRTVQSVWLVVTIFDVFLGFDFIFRALRANNAGFAGFVTAVAEFLGAPFDSIFPDHTTPHMSVIRWGDLLGMVIYVIFGAIAVKAIRIAKTPGGESPPVV